MNEDMAYTYKEMISRYIDDELTPKEREFIAKLLEENKALADYYDQLKGLDKVLNENPVEETSTDWESQVRSSFDRVHAGEDKPMNRTTLWRTSVGGGILATLIIMFLVSTQMYVKRGIQGRLKQAADDIGDQFSVGNTNVVKIMTTSSATDQTFLAGQSRSTLLGDEVTNDLMASNQTAQYEPYYLNSQYQVAGRATGGFQQSTYAGAVTDGPAQMQYEYWGGGKGEFEVAAEFNTEEYNRINDNEFLAVADNPLSTFSIDVDTGSYSNIRRFLRGNQLPPADAVRIEEMLNYFSYDYRKPEGDEPFSINIDAAVAPWNKDHQLVRIGLQGKTLAEDNIPPSNLVFLIDVSGSMDEPNKLPLVIRSLQMLVKQITEKERIAIVVYAGNAGLVLESTPGSNKERILEAIGRLKAGGSTAGGAGIQLAYQIAKDNFIKGGNNRVILATDGDFNVGVSSTSEMTRLIEEKRDDGIFITVLGYGMGNYKDGRLEQIANQGNGTYHYIDTDNEARKVMVEELGSTLFTIAKDVKIQIEFNPGQVKAYRLIGYENRILAKEDFNDDKKDAGELGAGHTVTALYEIVPASSPDQFRKVDALKYQTTNALDSQEVMTVKLRYKEPDGMVSKLITESVAAGDISAAPKGDFGFAAAVAEFGMLLRQSKFMGHSSYDHVYEAAQDAKGKDTFGYRAEFLEMVKAAASLDNRPRPVFEQEQEEQQEQGTFKYEGNRQGGFQDSQYQETGSGGFQFKN